MKNILRINNYILRNSYRKREETYGKQNVKNETKVWTKTLIETSSIILEMKKEENYKNDRFNDDKLTKPF